MSLDCPPRAHVLDDPVRAALGTRQTRFALRQANAWRFDPQVAPFCTLPAQPKAADLDDLAGLLEPGTPAVLTRPKRDVPAGWELVGDFPCLQMITTRPIAQPDAEIVELGVDDVAEMLALVELTRPGPFAPRTIELGRYLGIRRDGQLIAMAGERMSADGWTEVSAVCSHPDHRGQGLAARLIRAVGAGIEARGDGIFLHVLTTNASAIHVYEELGFSVRRPLAIFAVTPPAV